MARGRIRKLLLVVAGLVVVVLGVGAWLLRVEDIPDELPPVQGDPLAIELAPVADEGWLRLRELGGTTSFFVIMGPQSGDSKEGQPLNRALNRWVYPPTTRGYWIGDAEGFAMFRSKVSEAMTQFAGELRFPLHVDFEGTFIKTFGLSKGHHGFVVLGPDGTVLERRSGGAEGADLERIREMLGAREPDPVGTPPAFSIGGLADSDCGRGTACVVAFLGHAVARNQVPGIEDGFEGEDEQASANMRDPAIRNVSSAMRAKLEHARGVLVGATVDLEFPTWLRVDASPEGRKAFGVAEDESAEFVIDAQGRLAVAERGLVPLYRWGRIADLLGVEIDNKKIER